ncbi:MAG: signal peptidase I [Patescibacteria group bacterium]
MRKIFIFICLLPAIIVLSLLIPISRPLAPDYLPDPFLTAIRWTGSGSMHPTLPEGSPGQTMGYVYPEKAITLTRGDIITFDTPATSSGLIKRIIGLPGDTVELRDGLIYLNKEPLKEAYTKSSYSTYGHEFLPDCKVVTIPENKYFVLGDNRKNSLDSREIGFVDTASISATIPYYLQLKNLDAGWHDPTHDTDSGFKPQIDPTKYTSLLNSVRTKNNLQPLSYTGTNSWQPITGYIQHNGYYTAQELFDYQNSSPSFKKLVLEKDYQFVHISQTPSNISSCPNQLIKVTFSGYIPPNYSSQFISGWTQTLTLLKEIAPGWAALTGTPDARRINEIISLRIKNLTPIIKKINSAQWLTDTESAYLTEDIRLSQEQATLATQLNNQ